MRGAVIITISSSISAVSASKPTWITAVAVAAAIGTISALRFRRATFVALCSSRKVNVFATLMRTFPVSFLEDVLLVSVGVVFVVIHC